MIYCDSELKIGDELLINGEIEQLSYYDNFNKILDKVNVEVLTYCYNKLKGEVLWRRGIVLLSC